MRWSQIQSLTRIAFAGLLALFADRLFADNFQLRGGGQLNGLEESRTTTGDLVIKTPQGARIAVSKSQIQHRTREDVRLDEYQKKSRLTLDTPEGHHALASWCKQQHLKQQAIHHLQRVLELDPHDKTARRSLGFQQIGNHWFTREQLMAKRGLHFFEGTYRTAQDIEIRKLANERDLRMAQWQTNIKRWLRWLTNRRSTRATKAQEQLTEIHDPLAIPALVKFLDAQNDPQVRSLLISIIAQIDAPMAIRKLVNLSLIDPDPETRLQCLEYLMKSKVPIRLSPYIQSLSHPNNVIVNRAAVALQELADPAAISPLIRALKTTHKFKLGEGPPGQMNASTTNSSDGGGAGGFKFGGEGPKIDIRTLENFDVQRALIHLSGGKNFGFDQTAWRQWLINHRMQALRGARRDE